MSENISRPGVLKNLPRDPLMGCPVQQGPPRHARVDDLMEVGGGGPLGGLSAGSAGMSAGFVANGVVDDADFLAAAAHLPPTPGGEEDLLSRGFVPGLASVPPMPLAEIQVGSPLGFPPPRPALAAG